MSIFSLAHILAIALNRHSSATSSTATSSPLFLASFSLSTLLISLVLTVRLYAVSMASSLAHNSCIYLSLAESGIFIGLSLLLGGMAIKFSSILSTIERKELVLSSNTTLGADPDPRAKIRAGSFQIFPLSLIDSFISPQGILHTHTNRCIP
jgi:hypothetical protein